ncbi:MAG: UDP-N-acetylmuramoyl-tripeptide--D-alanyl-D-alanine ligase [Bacteroidales bacterium]
MKPAIDTLYKVFLKNPRISTDSRNVPNESIFFALKGDNFNGNHFALVALEKGAVLAVVDEIISGGNDKILRVDNVLETLQELARLHRISLGLKVIGITGTNGKTTTKELIQSVLKKEYNSLATSGNLNNHLGVPLTLLSLSSDHDIAVVEMGANHVGEIATLCEIARPDFGIITNIGKAHLEGFGSFEGVIRAKTELYEFIRKTGGKVFINADNKLLVKKAVNIDSISYGMSENLYCKGEFINDFPFLELNCALEGISVPVQSRLMGRYNFENILAAVCIGNYFHISHSDIQEAIETYQPTNNRSQIIHTKNNTLILDAYNANPSSMKAAIENFAACNFENKSLVLGDMAELGKDSFNEHTAVLKLLKSLKLHNVILVGTEYARANLPFEFQTVTDHKQLEELILQKQFRNMTILIKGSRRMQLEKITHLL